MQLRVAQPADSEHITQVRIICWKAAYANIIPEDFLTPDFIDQFVQQRRQSLAQPEAECTFVAVDEDRGIIAYAIGGPALSPHLPFSGELYEVYVLPTYQKHGIGRELTLLVACELLAQGHSSMMLHVLAENRNARQFYEKLAGTLIEQRSLDIQGNTVRDVAYGWSSIRQIPGIPCIISSHMQGHENPERKLSHDNK